MPTVQTDIHPDRLEVYRNELRRRISDELRKIVDEEIDMMLDSARDRIERRIERRIQEMTRDIKERGFADVVSRLEVTIKPAE